MFNSIETSTENSSFQPKSILKNSRSTPTLQSKPLERKNQTPKKKVSGFLKNLSILWNLLRLKVRSISEEVFNTDEQVDDLFVDLDIDDPLERLARSNRGYASAEERFLIEFKQHKSLDKMHEDHLLKTQPSHDESKSSMTAFSDAPTKGNNSLQDIIRQISDSRSNTPCNAIGDNGEEGEEDEEENLDLTTYQSLDICKLRKEVTARMKLDSVDNITDSTKSTVRTDFTNQVNIGETLWEYRRSKWLAGDSESEERAKKHLQELSIAHIPKTSYVRIYNNLVDKGRLLKNDKHINLSDLIKIINAGWISEDRWERAAKGLA